MSMGDDHTCWLVGKGIFRIKIYDGAMRELKEVIYVARMTKNLISIGALKGEGLKGTLEEGVLKMSRGSLVALKSIRCNNLYYLIGNAVTGLASSE